MDPGGPRGPCKADPFVRFSPGASRLHHKRESPRKDRGMISQCSVFLYISFLPVFRNEKHEASRLPVGQRHASGVAAPSTSSAFLAVMSRGPTSLPRRGTN